MRECVTGCTIGQIRTPTTPSPRPAGLVSSSTSPCPPFYPAAERVMDPHAIDAIPNALVGRVSRRTAPRRLGGAAAAALLLLGMLVPWFGHADASPAAAAADCERDWVEDVVLAPATSSDGRVYIACNLAL